MSSPIEKALVEWARRRLDRGPGKDRRTERFKLDDLATDIVEAVDFDTSPARQERDEDGLLERAIDRANFDAEDAVDHATATLLRIQRILEQPKGSIGKRKILRECRGAIVGLLTRLRAASGPGDPFALVTRMERELDAEEAARDLPPASNMGEGNPAPKVNPYRNGWTGEAAARPSGGEGAPEPDDRAIIKRLYGAAIGNAGVYPSSEWTDCATKDYQYLQGRLPPEREACSTCTEGQPPYFCRECVHRREEGLREALEAEAREPDAWIPELDHVRWMEGRVSFLGTVLCGTPRDDEQYISVFFGTPGPDREAEDGPETMERAWNHREAEIRADERRKRDEAIAAEIERAYFDEDIRYAVASGLERILAHLPPPDEQESPNRSDEP